MPEIREENGCQVVAMMSGCQNAEQHKNKKCHQEDAE